MFEKTAVASASAYAHEGSCCSQVFHVQFHCSPVLLALPALPQRLSGLVRVPGLDRLFAGGHKHGKARKKMGRGEAAHTTRNAAKAAGTSRHGADGLVRITTQSRSWTPC